MPVLVCNKPNVFGEPLPPYHPWAVQSMSRRPERQVHLVIGGSYEHGYYACDTEAHLRMGVELKGRATVVATSVTCRRCVATWLREQPGYGPGRMGQLVAAIALWRLSGAYLRSLVAAGIPITLGYPLSWYFVIVDKEEDAPQRFRAVWADPANWRTLTRKEKALHQ